MNNPGIDLHVSPLVRQAVPPADSEFVNLGDLFSTLWRGKWIIGLTTLLAIGVAGYYAFWMAIPLYRSTAVIILETRQEKVVDLQSVVSGMTGDTSEVNSEAEVLRSRGLIGKVVDQLNLTSDPEFNSRLRMPSLSVTAKSYVKSAFGLSPQQPDLPHLDAARRNRDDVTSALLNKITVRNISQSLVFKVTAETQSPQKSAIIADAVAELYVLEQLEGKFAATEQATRWLATRVSELQNELQKSEAAVASFNATTDLISIEDLQALERQAKETRDRIAIAARDADQAQIRLKTLEDAKTRGDRAAALAADPHLTRILVQPGADRITDAAFAARFEQVMTRAGLDLQRAQKQLSALRASTAQLQTQIARQSDDLIALQQLSREAAATRELYEYFLTRLKETSAQHGIQQADSRILSHAVIPSSPAFPRRSLILTMAGILGVLAGMVLVLLRETGKTGFRSARELESHTGMPVLSQIPQIPMRNRRKLLRFLADRPNSGVAEAMRNLRTSVFLSNAEKSPRVIIMASSVPDEGKTTNALALAQCIAGLGKSVLLIEGDMRRRSFRRYFDPMPDTGIAAVLAGKTALRDAVHYPATLGAGLLLADTTKANSADLLASDGFNDLVNQARSQFDVVIIDTPPVLVAPHARIIASMGDTVLFTVRSEATSKSQVDEALRIFATPNQQIDGLILSQINPKRITRFVYGAPNVAGIGLGTKSSTG